MAKNDGPEPHSTDEAASQRSHGDYQYKENGRCYRCMSRFRLGWVARLPRTWPRTFALAFGVVGPVFCLILISLFFGYFLAKLEAPLEIEANNEVIHTRAALTQATSFRRNLTEEIPSICLESYIMDDSVRFERLEEEIDRVFIRAPSTFNETEYEEDGFRYSNVTELFNFMEKCGKVAWKVADKYILIDDTIDDIESLSFNWITCHGQRNSSTFNQLMGSYLRPPFANITKLRPDVQEAFVVAEWRDHQRELFDIYFEQYRQEGLGLVDARIQALKVSFGDATGFDACEPNSAAGAWFWFTVMTTIGYGNTAPATEGGRAMVYTLGFLSILTFACVLGKAGHIVTTIFDDAVYRWRMNFLSIPWVACIWWGTCYYLWLVCIAAFTKNWKELRLGEEFEFADGYWFAYISTTTVGLGDFYLNHEVLLRRDLLLFALWFLAGFVLLANFLVKLTELITNLIPKKRRSLEETIEVTPICWQRKPNEVQQHDIGDDKWEETPHEENMQESGQTSQEEDEEANLNGGIEDKDIKTEGEMESGAVVVTALVPEPPETVAADEDEPSIAAAVPSDDTKSTPTTTARATSLAHGEW